eukprot:629073-Rhodomonas_salina.1
MGEKELMWGHTLGSSSVHASTNCVGACAISVPNHALAHYHHMLGQYHHTLGQYHHTVAQYRTEQRV